MVAKDICQTGEGAQANMCKNNVPNFSNGHINLRSTTAANRKNFEMTKTK